MDGKTFTCTIRCTPENVKDFQRLVKQDEKLLSTVHGLQEQGVFPGMRSMQITVTGSAELVAKGLGAWPVKSAAEVGRAGHEG